MLNCPPKSHTFTIPMYSELFNLLEQNNTSTDTSHVLNIFNIKLKKHEICKTLASKPEAKVGTREEEEETEDKQNCKNFAGRPKHFTPANQEWINSIYTYNKKTMKVLPATDRVILKLVKSYFNLYSHKLEKKMKSRRIRRARRLSTNRILVSRPELKHTNEKVTITIYAYNRQRKYYLNIMTRIASIDQIDNILPNYIKLEKIRYGGPWPSNLKMQVIRNKGIEIRSKMQKHKDIV